jgi:hypothetical protein
MSRVRHLQVICRTLYNRGKCRPEGQTSSTDAVAGRFHAGNLIGEAAGVKYHPRPYHPRPRQGRAWWGLRSGPKSCARFASGKLRQNGR